MRNPCCFAALITIFLATAIGCDKKSATVATEKIEPAHVAHHVDEIDLNTITLTPRAEARLGISLAEVLHTEVRRKRTVGGDVILPPGQAIVVTAPIAGTLATPRTGEFPIPGARLMRGQTVFSFKPLLSPERDVLTPTDRVRVAQAKADVATAQLEAQRRVESARIEVDAAQLAYDRTMHLLKSKAGSLRAVDEAEAQLKLAKEAKQTADVRYKLLSGIDLDSEPGQLEDRAIESPIDGVLQTLDSAPGETVTAGDVLFSVMKTDRVWIRVPTYVGQWREIDTTEPAMIAEFGSRDQSQPAKYVSAPPSADPITMTVDVFYALDNSDGVLYPGQKLSVTLPLSSRAKSLVVPYAAILYDVHGGTWVYQQQDDHVYARRRVSVEYVDGDQAILDSWMDPGSKVVTDGAAELFGTEFGVGH